MAIESRVTFWGGAISFPGKEAPPGTKKVLRIGQIVDFPVEQAMGGSWGVGMEVVDPENVRVFRFNPWRGLTPDTWSEIYNKNRINEEKTFSFEPKIPSSLPLALIFPLIRALAQGIGYREEFSWKPSPK